jgi:hypothetical protein
MRRITSTALSTCSVLASRDSAGLLSLDPATLSVLADCANVDDKGTMPAVKASAAYVAIKQADRLIMSVLLGV